MWGVTNPSSPLLTCGAYAVEPPFPPSRSIWDQAPLSYTGGVHYESHGCPYIAQHEYLPLPWDTPSERSFHALPWVTLAARYWAFPLIVCAAYLLLIGLGQRAMEGRKPFGLKGALAGWNALLAVFSLVGLARTGPHLLHSLFTRGPYYTVCAPAEPAFGQGTVGLWVALFCYSKVPELVSGGGRVGWWLGVCIESPPCLTFLFPHPG